MSLTDHQTAWNAMVMQSDPDAYPQGDERRAAALAAFYMGIANNGGLNHFLTASWFHDAQEVLRALKDLGATAAAAQLEDVLDKLDLSLPAQSQEERESLVDGAWTEDLDRHDVLTEEADDSLIAALEAHLDRHMSHYLDLAR